ncbi:MAG: nicotinamide-nucleotide adenylyltransferase [Pyrodictiaceae archaeon]
MRALYVGRFQPIHCGHVSVIKWLLARADEVIIVVGSAQESHTPKNPFTAGERIEMIKLALREESIPEERAYIAPVPDIAMNFVWVRYLKMLLPPFEYVVARNPLVVRLFEEAGVKVIVPPQFNRHECSATYIRKLMVEGGEWERLVPASVAEYIKKIKGIERLRQIMLGD